MKIEILQESEHYVLIKAPMLEDGSPPTRETILPMLEQLRDQGLRFLSLHAPPTERAAMICERLGGVVSTG